MNQKLTRRRFLAISAAISAVPGASLAGAPVARWQGTALGAGASMILVGMQEAAAQEIFTTIQSEVARLEGIFSLYHTGSALARLNETGRLADPPSELLDLLKLSDGLHRTTDGAFDPTVQPLWLLQAAAAAEERPPTPSETAKAQWQSGWKHLHFTSQSVYFARAGMALTLNGIAQGYIADRVAALLRSHGLTDVLIDMGEIAALGNRVDGTPWRAAIALPDGRIVREVKLGERALATSAPFGTLLDRSGKVGHILDPRTGQPGGRWQLASVSAPNAALADGLSTAFCLLTRDAISDTLAEHPGSSLEALL